MKLQQFCEELERQLSEAESCEEKVERTESLLLELSKAGAGCSENWSCSGERYARHLVFHGAQSGCCIVAMAWGPGQGTPVHDHDGTWCVECCLEGELEIVRYELQDTCKEAGEEQYLFEAVDSERVGPGNVGCLIPPYEHHVIRNPFDKRAVTLHVYGKELTKSSCFEPISGNRYRRVQKPLAYA